MKKGEAGPRGAANPNWRGGKSGKGSCQACGQPTWHTSATLCKNCYGMTLKGEGNPSWGKLTGSARGTGHDRALRRFELGICEECHAAPAVDRHHLDDNTLNNEPENVKRLCRRCHMILDGRLAKLAEMGRR